MLLPQRHALGGPDSATLPDEECAEEEAEAGGERALGDIAREPSVLDTPVPDEEGNGKAPQHAEEVEHGHAVHTLGEEAFENVLKLSANAAVTS